MLVEKEEVGEDEYKGVQRKNRQPLPPAESG